MGTNKNEKKKFCTIKISQGSYDNLRWALSQVKGPVPVKNPETKEEEPQQVTLTMLVDRCLDVALQRVVKELNELSQSIELEFKSASNIQFRGTRK